MKKILFVCVHNAGRSQMAEAFFNRMAKGRAQGFSAGAQVADKVNPMVVEAMREVGIDISRRKPKMLTLKMLEDADRVITMDCGAEGVSPASFVPTEDWQLEDPEGKPIEQVRQIRDEVKARVEGLITELGNGENFT
ncbi:MAG: arsenate reductase ArsC [Chloroflexi bacterium]|nr:arsenate reductase ArsC [Chloroflexota bacterium]